MLSQQPRSYSQRLQALLSRLAALRRLDLLTELGRWVLLAGVLATVLGLLGGWWELIGLGLSLLAVLAISVPWTIGRGPEHISLGVDPARVTVGQLSLARVISLAQPRRGVRALRIEVPVNSGLSAVDMPAVKPGQIVRREFELPTERRAVLTVGPARAVRSDPLGLARRSVATGEVHQVFVRPKIVRVPRLGSGRLRDLEGLPTTDLSPADVAFHALREYAPGDDRRHVHWRTTARTGQLMVRQFNDTRRAQLTLLLGADASEYASDDDFELAVSVVGSILASAIADGAVVRLRTRNRWLPCGTRDQLLDALAGVQLDRSASPAPIGHAVSALDPSTGGDVLLVIGRHAELRSLAANASALSSAVVTALRVVSDRQPGPNAAAGLRLLDLRQLSDLPRLLSLAEGR